MCLRQQKPSPFWWSMPTHQGSSRTQDGCQGCRMDRGSSAPWLTATQLYPESGATRTARIDPVPPRACGRTDAGGKSNPKGTGRCERQAVFGGDGYSRQVRARDLESTDRRADGSGGIGRHGQRANEGQPGTHQRLLLREQLRHIEELEARIARLTQEIAKRMRPFEDQLERLDTIPGVGRQTAEVILAEVGPDIEHFPSAAHLASWAGMCPGSHESAGKRKSGRTR